MLHDRVIFSAIGVVEDDVVEVARRAAPALQRRDQALDGEAEAGVDGEERAGRRNRDARRGAAFAEAELLRPAERDVDAVVAPPFDRLRAGCPRRPRACSRSPRLGADVLELDAERRTRLPLRVRNSSSSARSAESASTNLFSTTHGRRRGQPDARLGRAGSGPSVRGVGGGRHGGVFPTVTSTFRLQPAPCLDVRDYRCQFRRGDRHLFPLSLVPFGLFAAGKAAIPYAIANG